MKALVTAIALSALFAASPALALVPSSSQLARALAQVSHSAKAPALRHVHCAGIAADMTEVHCDYKQLDPSGVWATWYAMADIKGERWVVVDTPLRRDPEQDAVAPH
jgi:hypothetical protein